MPARYCLADIVHIPSAPFQPSYGPVFDGTIAYESHGAIFSTRTTAQINAMPASVEKTALLAALASTGLSAVGYPGIGWGFYRIIGTAAQITAALALSGVDAVPALMLDRPLSDLSSAQQTALRTRLTARGIDTSAYTGATLVRQVVRDILRKHHPASIDETILRNWP